MTPAQSAQLARRVVKQAGWLQPLKSLVRPSLRVGVEGLSPLARDVLSAKYHVRMPVERLEQSLTRAWPVLEQRLSGLGAQIHAPVSHSALQPIHPYNPAEQVYRGVGLFERPHTPGYAFFTPHIDVARHYGEVIHTYPRHSLLKASPFEGPGTMPDPSLVGEHTMTRFGHPVVFERSAVTQPWRQRGHHAMSMVYGSGAKPLMTDYEMHAIAKPGTFTGRSFLIPGRLDYLPVSDSVASRRWDTPDLLVEPLMQQWPLPREHEKFWRRALANRHDVRGQIDRFLRDRAGWTGTDSGGTESSDFMFPYLRDPVGTGWERVINLLRR